jgi:hypothetical protein
MRVASGGRGCALSFKFAGRFEPSEWEVEASPKHGRLEAHGASLTYFAEDGYSGPDAFTVKVFGFNPMLAHGRRSRNGRFAFTVDVVRAP